ncbi:MAG: GrpB family protein [Chloroflexi bacterium]|nr:GrpB family protein [Chloroflexota bacterium]
MWEAGRDRPTLRQKIAWEWGESTGGRFTGEFAPRKNTAQPVRLAGHLYVDLIWQSTNHDEVILVEHDPAWAQQFEQIAACLRKSLGPLALRIEHYGSTAIPGIPAKPLIDVLVEIPSFDEARSRLIPLFNRPEWEYWWYKEHMMFIRRTGIGGPRTHHLHIAPKDHPLWEGLIFRDYLRDHPDDAAQYAALKQQLAADFSSDRERYTQAKTDFVQQILAKAARTP